MSLQLLLRNTADSSTLVDLNGSGVSDWKVVYFSLGDPVVEESWAFSYHQDGGSLAKAPLRPRRMRFGLALPPQANINTLRSKVEAVRDALFTTGNIVRESFNSESLKRHRLIRSVIPSVLEADDDAARRVSVNLLIKLWPIEAWVEPTPVGELRSPVL